MDVTPLVRKGLNIIQGYSGGVFRVNGLRYDYPVIIAPDFIEKWDVGSCRAVEDLELSMFEQLISRSSEIDVVLLGTGKNIQILPAVLRADLKNIGLFVEFMDTGAACRTYNVLMAEDRRVICALLPE